MTTPKTAQLGGPKSLQIQLQQHTTNVGICNTYSIDKESMPNFIIASFGLILAKQITASWNFAINRASLLAWKQDFFKYAGRVRSLIPEESFDNPAFLSLRSDQISVIPVDFIALSHQDRIGEFSFHGWSIHATTQIAQENDQRIIQAQLYCQLRCTVYLQLNWLTDVYDKL